MMNTKFFLILSLATLILVSCSKKEEEATAITNGSAKISGVAKVQLDLTTPEAEFVPAGTKIIAIINTDELDLNADANIIYPEKTYTTTVGANGMYTLNIDANAKTVNVTISPNDFEAQQVQPDTTTIIRTVFSTAGAFATVVEGSHKIVDINY